MVKWYLPSFYGDIKLESQGDKRTMLTIHGLSPEEEHAMGILKKKAMEKGVFKEPWATADALASLNLRNTVSEQKLVLEASITDVQKVLAKALKPGRKKISAVKFSGGKIEEVTVANQGLIEVVSKVPGKDEEGPVRAEAVAATVAAPVRGCPEPDFTPADVRASAVLRAFLSPEQVLDFNTRGAFLVEGADSGHRYQLTSRQNHRELATVRRSLYDLDDRTPLCVHDWDVPASEELLAIMFCLVIPGREGHVRTLPEA